MVSEIVKAGLFLLTGYGMIGKKSKSSDFRKQFDRSVREFARGLFGADRRYKPAKEAELVVEFARSLLRDALSRCTPEQVGYFDRMYGSVEEIPYEKMRWAYMQIHNTLSDLG